MKQLDVNVEIPRGGSSYRVSISSGTLSSAGTFVSRQLGSVRRAAICSNKTVHTLYGKVVEDSLAAVGIESSAWLMRDGEQFKSWTSASRFLEFLGAGEFDRIDVVISLGGGVVGDLSGFAASLHRRGIPFIQIPTTLLAMVDASVGGKTGVNSKFGKNTIGTFHQPAGVLIDLDVLGTLPRRELTSGYCEMVKHGAIGGTRLLTPLARFLETDLRKGSALRFDSEGQSRMFAKLVSDHVSFKAGIVSGDERESIRPKGRNSRMVLNFGHTFAHALEKCTDYRYFRHGEAVGYGILYAAELSKSLALLDKKSVKLLYDVVHRTGNLPALGGIDKEEILDAFRSDKKSASGSLQFILLRGIGKPVIVSGDKVPHRLRLKALNDLLRQF